MIKQGQFGEYFQQNCEIVIRDLTNFEIDAEISQELSRLIENIRETSLYFANQAKKSPVEYGDDKLALAQGGLQDLFRIEEMIRGSLISNALREARAAERVLNKKINEF